MEHLPDSVTDADIVSRNPARDTDVLGKHKPEEKNTGGIRQQLRSWSQQQAQKVSDAGPSGVFIPLAESATLRPSSLFLEQNSNEEDLEDEYEGEDLVGDDRYRIQPGDAIELLRVVTDTIGGTNLHVFLRTVGTQNQYIAEDGRWVSTAISRPKTYPVRGFATQDMIEPLLQFLPTEDVSRSSNRHGMLEHVIATGDIPSDISAPLMAKMRTLKEEVITFRREHVLTMEKTHELLADDEKFIVRSVDDCTRQLFGQPVSQLSPGANLAFFKAMEKDPLGCQICKRMNSEFTLILTPKTLVRKFEKVRDWARQYQDAAAQASLGKDVTSSLSENPLNTFVDKARRIIVKSRKLRSPTTIGTVGPTTGHRYTMGEIGRADTGEIFSESDNMVIEFLWNTFLRKPKVLFNGAARSIASLILRAIGAYPNLRLEDKIGHLLLQELGVKSPWAEVADEDVVLPIPGRPSGHEADRLFAETEQLASEMGLDIPPHEMTMQDSMAHLRHDWGSTPVFCIDKPTSDILDDAFSVEKCSEIPGAHWLHVHIAQPAAYISPDHPFSKRAAVFGASLYTSQQSYPMLPYFFALGMGIGPNRPCLTVSSLILPSGEVQEVKMVPSMIRKVVKLNPKAVDLVLGRVDKQMATFTVGGTHRKRHELPQEYKDAAMKHIETLETARQICVARMKRRLEEVPEIYDCYYRDSNFDVWVSATTPFDPRIPQQSQHYLGDPIINVVGNRFEVRGRGITRYEIDALTTQLMSVGSEMAARWCREREIPALYQSSQAQPGWPLSKLKTMKKTESGIDPHPRLTSTPAPHVLLNCNEYLRFTSPIRRYTDLVAHWQINAYLLQEGPSSDRKLGYNTDELPFSKADLDRHIDIRLQTSRDLDRLMRRSKEHWTYQAFFRAFHFKEATLPEVWDLCVEKVLMKVNEKSDDSGLRGRLVPFQLTGLNLLKSEEGYEQNVLVGQYLPVKIELVDTSVPTMMVRAVGPPTDEPSTMNPIEVEANLNPEMEVKGATFLRGVGDERAMPVDSQAVRRQRKETAKKTHFEGPTVGSKKPTLIE